MSKGRREIERETRLIKAIKKVRVLLRGGRRVRREKREVVHGKAKIGILRRRIGRKSEVRARMKGRGRDLSEFSVENE